MLILVISLAILVIFLLTGITICVVKRRRKDGGPGLSESGEVSHNLMPPPTPTQWSHMYTTAVPGGAASYTDSSHYDGNQYEVPHHHGGKTPAPSLRYGFSGYPADGGGHIYIPQHVMPVYYPDNRPTV